MCIRDREIPVDIVNLGLIYDVAVIELENGLHHVAVKMTLTAPGCGMGPHLVMEAKDRIEALEGVEAEDVEICLLYTSLSREGTRCLADRVWRIAVRL